MSWGLGFKIFLALVVVIGLAVIGNFTYRYFTAPIKGVVEEREITNKGPYRIQAYEQFYRWEEEIGAIDNKLLGYTDILDLRERQECRGLLARRYDLIADYNSASLAVRTQGKWRAPDLPKYLENLHKMEGRC